MSKVLRIVAALCALARPATADCDHAAAEARIAKVRAVLAHDAVHARRWNLAWGIGFGAAAAGQFALTLADYSPLAEYTDDVEHGLYIASAKAAIASLTHVILPLKIVRPGPRTDDVCADLAAAERALHKTGTNEKRAFWLNHLGGLAMNVAGVLILGMGLDSWREAWLGFAIGYPVGVIHAYTQPRRGWHWARNVSVTPIQQEGVTGLAIGGVF